MQNKQENIKTGFLFLAGLIIFMHSVIPHHHHFNYYSDCEQDVTNPVAPHTTDNFPFHCHALNLLAFDKLDNISVKVPEVIIPNDYIAAVLMIMFVASSILKVDYGTGILFSSPSTPIAIEVKRGNREETNFTVTITESNLVEMTKIDNILYIKSTSITNQGNLDITIRSGKDVWSNTISIRISTADKDRDGYPDVVELGNNEAFREWFCAIIESQFFYPNDNWYDVHKDCVGLVEFAFKEALKKHDNNWAKNYKYLPPVNIDDSRDYYYPNVPLINKRVFRVKPGEFRIDNISNDFAYTRSEERRVGKECRSRWSPYH